MSALELPESVDVERLVSHGAVLEGEIAVSRLTRLAEVYQVRSSLTARVEFVRDAEGRARIAGRLDVALGTTCQRCLKPLEFELDREFGSLLCTEAEAERLDEDPDAEPVVIGADGLRVASFLEDEALLSCPMIALHDFGTCEAPGEVVESRPPETRKPFAGLDKLLGGKPGEGGPD
jgi:uncharacterized protein